MGWAPEKTCVSAQGLEGRGSSPGGPVSTCISRQGPVRRWCSGNSNEWTPVSALPLCQPTNGRPNDSIVCVVRASSIHCCIPPATKRDQPTGNTTTSMADGRICFVPGKRGRVMMRVRGSWRLGRHEQHYPLITHCWGCIMDAQPVTSSNSELAPRDHDSIIARGTTTSLRCLLLGHDEDVPAQLTNKLVT